jgi:hypothetical protein
MRLFVIMCSFVVLSLFPGAGLLHVASAQEEAPDPEWEAFPGDYPDDPALDEDLGQYDPDDLAPEDLPLDEGAFDEAPSEWDDEVPMQGE